MIDPASILSNSLLLMAGYLVFGVAITIYQLYLNRKQAKVNEQMKELIKIVGRIESALQEKFDDGSDV
jgi:CcmD family protein